MRLSRLETISGQVRSACKKLLGKGDKKIIYVKECKHWRLYRSAYAAAAADSG